MEFITLGIGTPSDIPHFILVGLSPTGPVSVTALDVGETQVYALAPVRAAVAITPARGNTGITPIRSVVSLEE